ncbi:MAG: hypothetical protein V4585_09805 [Bacteroidota bacterium]
MLILLIPLISGGVIIYHSLTKNIEFSMDDELENSEDDMTSDSSLGDITQIEYVPNLNIYLFKFELPVTHPTTSYLLRVYDIYLEQNPPPP